MSDGEQLTVSSTTDIPAVVEAVASGEPEASRALVHESSLADFSESESSDGQTTTTAFENPSSERQALLARLEEAEKEVVQLPEVAEEGQAAESPIDMDEVRRIATQDAIEDARRLHRQAYQPNPEIELERLRGELSQDFARRMNAIKPANFEQVVQAAVEEGTDVSPEVRDALLMLPNGERVALYLWEHAEERRYLSSLTDTDAVTRTAILASKLAASPRRAVSRAPQPIVPVGGSSTRSSVSMDELPYSDYRAARERQIKASKRR